MQFTEYGRENEKVMIFLHGGGLAPWNYFREAEVLKRYFHIVIPILDGHSGSSRDFTTIEENAKELIDHIDKAYNGRVYLTGGLSLGGQILTEMLSQRGNICEYAVIESALVLPMKMTAKLIKPAFSICYPLIKRKWFARLQFQSLHMDPAFFEEYFRDSAAITRENMTAFLTANAGYKMKGTLADSQAKALIIAGGKERPIIKKSARIIHEGLPGSSLKILPGYRHGELSLNHPEEYVEMIRRLTGFF